MTKNDSQNQNHRGLKAIENYRPALNTNQETTHLGIILQVKTECCTAAMLYAELLL